MDKNSETRNKTIIRTFNEIKLFCINFLWQICGVCVWRSMATLSPITIPELIVNIRRWRIHQKCEPWKLLKTENIEKYVIEERAQTIYRCVICHHRYPPSAHLVWRYHPLVFCFGIFCESKFSSYILLQMNTYRMILLRNFSNWIAV